MRDGSPTPAIGRAGTAPEAERGRASARPDVTHGVGADWLVCERTAAALERLEEVLRGAARAEDLQLRVIALELVERGGKRLRPALLLLSAMQGDFREAVLLPAAAALEMVHVASLYHDDVMDRAPLRRRGASVNARWGNTLASLGGTYLFARASALLASLGETANRLASQAFVELCAGQLQEIENAYNLELSEDEHLEILTRKTGTLFALPCRLGAHLSAAPLPVADVLADYGRHLGLAFQLADDALDIVGRPGQTGKAAGTDLREGVYGLSVLRALRRTDGVGERMRQLLGQVSLAEEDVQEVLALVRASGGVDAAIETAREHAVRAGAALTTLPEGPGRRSLERLAEYAVARSG